MRGLLTQSPDDALNEAKDMYGQCPSASCQELAPGKLGRGVGEERVGRERHDGGGALALPEHLEK